MWIWESKSERLRLGECVWLLVIHNETYSYTHKHTHMNFCSTSACYGKNIYNCSPKRKKKLIYDFFTLPCSTLKWFFFSIFPFDSILDGGKKFELFKKQKLSFISYQFRWFQTKKESTQKKNLILHSLTHTHISEESMSHQTRLNRKHWERKKRIKISNK